MVVSSSSSSFRRVASSVGVGAFRGSHRRAVPFGGRWRRRRVLRSRRRVSVVSAGVGGASSAFAHSCWLRFGAFFRRARPLGGRSLACGASLCRSRSLLCVSHPPPLATPFGVASFALSIIASLQFCSLPLRSGCLPTCRTPPRSRAVCRLAAVAHLTSHSPPCARLLHAPPLPPFDPWFVRSFVCSPPL